MQLPTPAVGARVFMALLNNASFDMVSTAFRSRASKECIHADNEVAPNGRPLD
jgi:hypothetical protein